MKSAKLFDWLTLLTWMQYYYYITRLLYTINKVQKITNATQNPFCIYLHRQSSNTYKRCDEIKNLLIKTDIISWNKWKLDSLILYLMRQVRQLGGWTIIFSVFCPVRRHLFMNKSECDAKPSFWNEEIKFRLSSNLLSPSKKMSSPH